MTLEYANANCGSALAQLNHAHALAMVGRGAEAACIMERMPSLVSPEFHTVVALVELEIHLAQREDEAAREASGRIDEAFLFPAQIQWLTGVRKRLGSERGK